MSAAAYLFTSPQFRPLSPSGSILPGAYVQFYEAGTTTPTDVYADADLNTPLSNPVVADTSGEFVPIYLDPSVTYRAQLYDEDDVLKWDVDPLAPPRDYAPGTILMFFGSLEDLETAYPPALWQQLDGNNGAPDIQGRVPVGVSGSLSPGDTGGASGVVNTSSAGAHDHGGDTGTHAISEAEMPEHRHRLLGSVGDGAASPLAGTSSAGISGHRNGGAYTYHDDPVVGGPLVEDTGDGDPHDHGIGSDGDHIHTVDVNPPFLALYFIMRRAV
jgi:hypothetical protein